MSSCCHQTEWIAGAAHQPHDEEEVVEGERLGLKDALHRSPVDDKQLAEQRTADRVEEKLWRQGPE